MNKKIKNSLLILGLGLGLSSVANAGPEPGSDMCLAFEAKCIATGGVRVCNAYQRYCV